MSVHAAQNGDIYSGATPSNGIGGLIFESTDLTNWQFYGVDQPINDMTSYGSDITFGVGDSGFVVVNTPIADLGLEESDQLKFDIYPNPVPKELTIKNPQLETIELRILDASGRVLKTEIIYSGINTVNISNLNSGIYFVQATTGSRSGLKRIVKQ